MPDAVMVSIAKEVTAMLKAAALSKECPIERSYADWEVVFADTEAGELRIDVVAVTTEQKAEPADRNGKLRYTIPVHIAVRQKLGQDKQDDDTGRIKVEEVDELTYLVQQVHELFTEQRLTSFQAGVYDNENPVKILVNPDTTHLREKGQFTGVVQVTFKAHTASGA